MRITKNQLRRLITEVITEQWADWADRPKDLGVKHPMDPGDVTPDELLQRAQKASGTPPSSPPSKYTEFAGGWPMKVGHKGEMVKALQTVIGAKPDGFFGPNTQAKLQAYAKAGGVTEVSRDLFKQLAKAAMGDAKKKAPKKADEPKKPRTPEEKEAELAEVTLDSLDSFNLKPKRVQQLWDRYVTTKRLRLAKANPSKAFVKAIKGAATDEGLVYASLYYAGGYSKIRRGDFYDEMLGDHTPKRIVHADMSGPEQRFADWLGARDRKKQLSIDGTIKGYVRKQ